MAKGYFAMAKDLKNAGQPTLIACDAQYPLANGGTMFVRVNTEGFNQPGTDLVG